MRRTLAIVVIVLCMGCAQQKWGPAPTVPSYQTARGDSSATHRTCELQTFDAEGNEISCTKMVERTVVGGEGSDKIYEFGMQMTGMFLNVASILIQALSR